MFPISFNLQVIWEAGVIAPSSPGGQEKREPTYRDHSYTASQDLNPSLLTPVLLLLPLPGSLQIKSPSFIPSQPPLPISHLWKGALKSRGGEYLSQGRRFSDSAWRALQLIQSRLVEGRGGGRRGATPQGQALFPWTQPQVQRPN